MRPSSGLVLFCGLLATGCAADDPIDAYEVVVLVDGLDGPTQFAITDEAWFVAHLNGGERDRQGQVLRFDPADLTAPPVVVADGLDKPTGVAVFAGELWVMEKNRLTRGPLDGGGREVVVEDLASNSRSEGTLTVDGDRLLFHTSGSNSRFPTGPGDDPTATSGAIWSVTADGTITNIAWGFKNAYVRTRDLAGVLWSVELSDGTFDGEVPVEEVVAVVEGANHGWPACVGDNRPVAESGIDEPCSGVPRSQATFAPAATPTGLAVSPWRPGALVVALWLEGRIVEISADPADAPAPATLVTDRVARPQHLEADGDRLLATDHEAGTLVEIRRT